MADVPPPSREPYRPSPADRRRARRELLKMIIVLGAIAGTIALAWGPVDRYFHPPDTALQAAVAVGDADATRRLLAAADRDAATLAYSAYERALRALSPSDPRTTQVLRALLAYEPRAPHVGITARSPRSANVEFRVPHRQGPTTIVSAVEIAAQRWSPDGVRTLLDAGLDVKSVGASGALTAAAANQCEPIIRMLLDAGTDVNARDRSRDTPLAMARRMNHGDVAALLVSRGARD